jgi:glutamyl/glutaminyl-tRNA synthetase
MDVPVYDLALLVPHDMYAAVARKALAAVDQALAELPDGAVDPLSLDRTVRGVAAQQGVEPASLFQVVRVALLGNLASPGLYDAMAALGRDGVRKRLDAALTRLSDIAATQD